ncbi:MFS general substrate transporter [Biscogniauxia sp. FL1348]|nr:MFS general substrate transporter [Biscogniauxia sp. FL1348]
MIPDDPNPSVLHDECTNFKTPRTTGESGATAAGGGSTSTVTDGHHDGVSHGDGAVSPNRSSSFSDRGDRPPQKQQHQQELGEADRAAAEPADAQAGDSPWAEGHGGDLDGAGAKGQLGTERAEANMPTAETMSLPREILFVAIICLAQVFTQAGLGQTLSLLRVLESSLGSPQASSWVLAGYSLTVGTLILPSGRLGDILGYKRVFLAGLAWFSAWSLACGFVATSSSPPRTALLILARALQGLGPAVVLPNALALLGASYYRAPGARKALVFALFGAAAPGGSVVGSAFAALCAERAAWPWAFWALALCLAVAVVLAALAIPGETRVRRGGGERWGVREMLSRLDALGAVLGVAGLVLVNVAWNEAPAAGWAAPYVGGLLGAGAVLLALFCAVEARWAAHPLVPFAALSGDVAFVLAAVGCGWASFGVWVFYTWELLLGLRGETPLVATAMFVPVAVSGCGAAIFTGLMLPRLGPAVVMMCALLAFTVGLVLVATCPVEQTYWAQTFISVVVMPWGMDMSFPAGTLILSNAMPRRHQGIAASLVNTVVNYSISLGLGFAGTVEVNVNNGGTNPEDVLKGYRGAYYMGIGLAGLGVLVSLAFLVKTKHKQPANAHSKA